MNKPNVICIAGIPGSGKSFLSAALSDNLCNSIVLSGDNYLNAPVKESDFHITGPPITEPSKIELHIDRWENPNLLKALIGHLNEKNGCQYIILDDLRGKISNETKSFIDFAFWIKTPPEIALARFIAREMRVNSWSNDWISKYLKAYNNQFRATHLAIEEIVEGSCDKSLNGILKTEILVKSIIDTLHI